MELSPRQRRARRGFEGAIRLAAPFLDAVLAVGDRISRLAEPVDYEHYPVRAGEAMPEVSPTRSGAAEPGRRAGSAASPPDQPRDH